MSVVVPGAPGVYSQRIDKSGFIPSTGSTAMAICGYSLKGPLKPRLLTNTSTLDTLFGKPSAKVSYAHYGARTIINDGFPVYFRRVVNGAKYGGLVVLSDASNNTVTIDKYPATGSSFAADADPTSDIAPVGPSYIALTFNGPFVASNTINLNVVMDSQVVAISPVTYTGNSDATMVLLASAIETALATGGSGGKATVIDNDATSNTNARTIGIFGPSGQSIAITGVVVTGGVSQATATQQTPLCYIQAENPGAWSQEAGIKLTNADIGTREVINMTFASSVGSVSSVTVTVNGVACAAVTNVVPSDAFLQAVADALIAHADVDTAFVNKKPLGEANDRVITFTMLRGSSTDAVVSAATTGAAPVITFTQAVKGVSPSGAFDLEVYNASNPTVAVERHRVNLAAKADNLGVQQKIDYVVNKAGTASDIIRVIPNAADDGSVVIPFNPATGAIMTGVSWLSAGVDGSIPTSAQIAEAWKDFENTELYPINILVNTGYTSVTIGQAMCNVAKTRNDGTQAVIDIPPEYQKYSSLINYRLQQMAIDTEYGAAYYPDVQQEDPYTGIKLWVPPSAHVAAMYGRNDLARGMGAAPAGIRRGGINTTAVRYDYKLEEESYIFSTLKLNIIKRKGLGFVAWGDSTLLSRDSAFSYVSVTRLVGMLEGKIRNFGESYVFEGNTDVTVFSLITQINQFLGPFKPNDLNDFSVVSNSDNNPAGIIEQGMRIIDVILDPVRSMRRLLVRTTVTQVGGIASIQVTEL